MPIPRLTLALGGLLTAISVIALLFTVIINDTLATTMHLTSTGFILMCLLQAIAGLFIAYASQMKIMQHDIAEKLYPSCIAVQILLLLMWQYSM